jgi:hypothetical protein
MFTRVTGISNPFNGFDVGADSAPALGDLDGDGFLDALIGNSAGELRFLKGQGPSSEETFTVNSGPCIVTNGCVQSPNYPSAYGDSQNCSFSVAASREIIAESFQTESSYDWLTVSGVHYSGIDAPSGTVAEDIFWTSDSTIGSKGWRLCEVFGGKFKEVTGTANPFNVVSVSTPVKPSLGDLDGDGLVDVLVGQKKRGAPVFEGRSWWQLYIR